MEVLSDRIVGRNRSDRRRGSVGARNGNWRSRVTQNCTMRWCPHLSRGLHLPALANESLVLAQELGGAIGEMLSLDDLRIQPFDDGGVPQALGIFAQVVRYDSENVKTFL